MARPRNPLKEQEMKALLTQEYLRCMLDYNPDTGILMRKAADPNLPYLTNRPFGCTDSNGYVKVMLNRFHTYAHILIWVFVYGQWPEGEIDHIDQNPSNNRLCNLREVTTAVQQKNVKKSTRNQTGYVGVSLCPNNIKRYKSTTTVNKKSYHHGYFYTPEEANAARQQWIQDHPEAGFTENHGK